MKFLRIAAIIGNLALFIAFVFIIVNTVAESVIFSRWVTVPLLSVGIAGDLCQIVIRFILNKRERDER